VGEGGEWGEASKQLFVFILCYNMINTRSLQLSWLTLRLVRVRELVRGFKDLYLI
jgi:hypothetical protein